MLDVLAPLPTLHCLYSQGNPYLTLPFSDPAASSAASGSAAASAASSGAGAGAGAVPAGLGLRRGLVSRLTALRFLDDRPVTPQERRIVAAWARGGAAAEATERAALADEGRRAQERELDAWRAMREREAAARGVAAAALNSAFGAPAGGDAEGGADGVAGGLEVPADEKAPGGGRGAAGAAYVPVPMVRYSEVDPDAEPGLREFMRERLGVRPADGPAHAAGSGHADEPLGGVPWTADTLPRLRRALARGKKEALAAEAAAIAAMGDAWRGPRPLPFGPASASSMGGAAPSGGGSSSAAAAAAATAASGEVSDVPDGDVDTDDVLMAPRVGEAGAQPAEPSAADLWTAGGLRGSIARVQARKTAAEDALREWVRAEQQRERDRRQREAADARARQSRAAAEGKESQEGASSSAAAAAAARSGAGAGAGGAGRLSRYDPSYVSQMPPLITPAGGKPTSSGAGLLAKPLPPTAVGASTQLSPAAAAEVAAGRATSDLRARVSMARWAMRALERPAGSGYCSDPSELLPEGMAGAVGTEEERPAEPRKVSAGTASAAAAAASSSFSSASPPLEPPAQVCTPQSMSAAAALAVQEEAQQWPASMDARLLALVRAAQFNFKRASDALQTELCMRIRRGDPGVDDLPPPSTYTQDALRERYAALVAERAGS